MDPVNRTLFVGEYLVSPWTPSFVHYLWVSMWCMDPVNRTLFVGEYVVHGPRQSYVICG